MLTNARLKKMDAWDQHKAIHAALVGARLHDLLPCLWTVEGRDGCDTVHMLRVVCLEQTAERTVPFTQALGLLMDGHAPRGATPYPDAAEALLAIRGVIANA